jgi:hypothetical protein
VHRDWLRKRSWSARTLLVPRLFLGEEPIVQGGLAGIDFKNQIATAAHT